MSGQAPRVDVESSARRVLEQEVSLPPGTPLGIPGHIPNVPLAAGVHPWCSCGHRWDPRDPDSELVGQHIVRLAREAGVPTDTPGHLR